MRDDLHGYLAEGGRTLLGVGPMSRTCIEAAAEISRAHDVPLQLIASRRQIDAEEFGGGYVEGMSTGDFAAFVRSLKADRLFLARDHGGPWQSLTESKQKLDAEAAMESSLRSFQEDIEQGFDFIHIDPSVPIGEEELTPALILERLCELYAACCEIARKAGRLDQIAFELGTEEQSGYGTDLSQMELFIDGIADFCRKHNLPAPSLIVAQTGTKVMETANVGVFAEGEGTLAPGFLDHLRATVALCRRRGLFLKEHNTDYLSDNALALRPVLGIHASNVAPEFGVVETRGLLYALRIHGMKREHDTFVEIALESGKWGKWMLPATKATDIDRAIICGHYVFADPRVREIRARLGSLGEYVEDYLRRLVRQSMLRYLTLFNAF